MSRRRQYTPIGIPTGSPTLEANKHRRPVRRRFTQLSGATGVPPIPVGGRIYRTFAPASVADYEGISTATWSSGSSGSPQDTNCLYYHFTSPNQRSTTVTYLMNPIRWACDVPTVSGGNYDYWDANSSYGWEATVSTQPSDSFLIGMTNGLLPVGSHIAANAIQQIEFPISGENRITAEPAPWDNFTGRFRNATFQAIASTIPVAAGFSARMKYIRHRVNGVAVGDLIEDPVGTAYNAKYRVALSVGDTYEMDVWYELNINAVSIAPSTSGKACFWIPTSRVSTGSTRFMQRHLAFRGYDFSPAYNYQSQSYSITLAGSHTWRLPNGTNTDQITTHNGWQATREPGRLRWTAPSSHAVQFMELYYLMEVPYFLIRWTDSYRLQKKMASQCYYRPNSGALYLTDTYDRNSAQIITHDRHGTFNQAGTTTFAKCRGVSAAYKGYVLPPVTIAPEIPTTVTLTRINV